MQSEFRNRLRPTERGLVDEIEAHTKFPITVREDASLSDATMRIVLEFNAATILVRSAEDFTPGGAYHELTHAAMYYLRGVPHLVVCDDAWTSEREHALLTLDNALEHLCIIPHEIEQFPERRERWVNVMDRHWQRIASLAEADGPSARMEALVAWVETALLDLSPRLLARARQELQRLGVADEGERLLAQVRSGPLEKLVIAEKLLAALGVDSRLVCLETVDPDTRVGSTRPFGCTAA